MPGSTSAATAVTDGPGASAAREKQTVARLSLGGCDFLEDPNLDARTVDLLWLLDPDALIAVGPAVRDDGDRFSLWAVPGRKSLVHDGRRLLVRAHLSRRVLRLAVSLGLGEGEPYAFAVSPKLGEPSGEPLAEIGRTLAGELDTSSSGPSSPRKRVVHMRALMALDVDAAGGAERDIAMAIFGEADRSAAFNDSAPRAQVRYLLDHGRAYRDGGYRSLLRADAPRPKPTRGRTPAF